MVSGAPQLEPREGRGAPLQEPRHTHTQLRTLQPHLRQPSGADGCVLFVAVDGRERREPFRV